MAYTYVIKGVPSMAKSTADPIYGTRHEAVGKKAILEAIHDTKLRIVSRKRYATDPVR